VRLPLADGQYAVLRDRLTYGQGRQVRLALLAAEKDRAAMADLDLALIGAYVSEWSVRDLAGEFVPLDKAAEAPDDVVQAIALAAMDAWKGRLDVPKATAARSRSSRRARPSRQ
jgi:hypothetical protein